MEIRTAFQYGDAPPLAVAEQAVRECPGDYELLALAATAALVEGRTDRAQLFLKRMKKRFVPGPADALLQALLLDQQKRRPAAAELLQRNGFTTYHGAMSAFPAGVSLSKWLSERLYEIAGIGYAPRGRVKPKAKAESKPKAAKTPTLKMAPSKTAVTKAAAAKSIASSFSKFR